MHDIDLDPFDLKLLAALEADGRLTNGELAESVGLSASQCSRRRTRLEDSGLIRGYRAELAAERLGFAVLAFVQVSLAAHSPENAERFRRLVNEIDAVQEAYSLTGETDYLLKMIFPDLRSLSAAVNDALLAHPSVARVRSSIVLDRLKETARLPLGTSGPKRAVRP